MNRFFSALVAKATAPALAGIRPAPEFREIGRHSGRNPFEPTDAHERAPGFQERVGGEGAPAEERDVRAPSAQKPARAHDELTSASAAGVARARRVEAVRITVPGDVVGQAPHAHEEVADAPLLPLSTERLVETQHWVPTEVPGIGAPASARLPSPIVASVGKPPPQDRASGAPETALAPSAKRESPSDINRPLDVGTQGRASQSAGLPLAPLARDPVTDHAPATPKKNVDSARAHRRATAGHDTHKFEQTIPITTVAARPRASGGLSAPLMRSESAHTTGGPSSAVESGSIAPVVGGVRSAVSRIPPPARKAPSATIAHQQSQSQPADEGSMRTTVQQTVAVNIGRIEIKHPQPPPRTPARRIHSAPMGLVEYLDRRFGVGRRE